MLKLARAVRTLAVADRDAAWVERHLRPLVGLESDAYSAGDRSEAFAAWRRFIEALGEQRPHVLVFEDLQSFCALVELQSTPPQCKKP